MHALINISPVTSKVRFSRAVNKLYFMNLDPFIRSMSCWLLKDYNESLEVLLKPPVDEQDDKKKVLEDYAYPSVFNFYYYLRSHPLLRRRFYIKQKSWKNRRATFLGAFSLFLTDPCPSISSESFFLNNRT